MRAQLIRHGKTAGNLAGRYVGRSDVPLCPEGRAEALCARRDETVKTVYVSPLLRARETAAILFPNAEQIAVDALREMDFGDFEGRTAAEMEHDPAYRAWVDDLCRGACPGGESQAEFHDRVKTAFLETVQKTRADATVVAHGGVIMSILYQFARPEKAFYEWMMPNLGGFEADCVTDNGATVLINVRPLPVR